MQVHVWSERMLGSEIQDWLRNANPFQLRFNNTNLRLYQISRHYNHSNEPMLIIMDTKPEEVSRDKLTKILPPADLWCDDVLFSTIRCHRNQGKNILNPIWSFDLNLTYYPGINTEVYQAWNAWSWLVGLVSPGTIHNKVNNFIILITLAGARCHNPPQSQEELLGQCLTTVSSAIYNRLFLTDHWPRWGQHHSAQSEPWDGGTRLSY